MYFPARIWLTAGVRLLPAAYFQNWSSGLIHSDLPIFNIENVPSPLIPISPLQFFLPTVRLKEMTWPESATFPVMWTDDTVLKSVAALAAIWSAVIAASGLPDGCADADAVAVLFVVAEVLGALEPQAVAVPRIAAPKRVTATARR